MNTIDWIFFISTCISLIISVTLTLVYIFEEELYDLDKSIIGIGLNFLIFLLVGLIFYTTTNIFKFSTSIIIYQIGLGVSTLSSLLLIYRIFKTNIDSNWASKVLSILILGLTVYLLLISFDIKAIGNTLELKQTIELNSKFIFPIKEIILVFWIPVFIILFIYWNSTLKNKNLIKLQNGRFRSDNSFGELDYVIDEIYYRYRDDLQHLKGEDKFLLFERIKDFIRKSKIDEELKYIISRNLKRLFDEGLNEIPVPKYEFKELILDKYYQENRSKSNIDSSKYLLEEITERFQSILKKELKRNITNVNIEENKDFAEIRTLIQSVNDIKNILNTNVSQFAKIDYSTQQLFIRELYHYLMTPLSQINAASITVETLTASDQLNPKIERNIKAIKAGVELCQSVLTAYRQLAFIAYNNKDEDRIDLQSGIKAAELLYQESNNKALIIEHSQIPETINGYSNNFILAILLPLIENAICASNDKSTFKTEIIERENSWEIVLINSTKSLVNLDNFNKVGFSSKNDHEGTGLSIVRNLIANLNGSTLEFEIKANQVITKLNLSKYDV